MSILPASDGIQNEWMTLSLASCDVDRARRPAGGSRWPARRGRRPAADSARATTTVRRRRAMRRRRRRRRCRAAAAAPAARATSRAVRTTVGKTTPPPTISAGANRCASGRRGARTRSRARAPIIAAQMTSGAGRHPPEQQRRSQPRRARPCRAVDDGPSREPTTRPSADRGWHRRQPSGGSRPWQSDTERRSRRGAVLAPLLPTAEPPHHRGPPFAQARCMTPHFTARLAACALAGVLAAGCGSHHIGCPRRWASARSRRCLSRRRRLLPTINVVEAIGWADGDAPTAAAGATVAAFARGLDHPRWLHVLPNGDVLVAETNAPPRPDDDKGIKGWFFKRYQKKAGGAVPERQPHHAAARRRRRRHGRDADRFPDRARTSPFGMALVGDALYVANTDAIVKVPVQGGRRRPSTRRRREGGRSAGRRAQPPLDQEPHRQPRRQQALRRHRLEQQRRRERHGRGEGPRRGLGGRRRRPARTASSPSGLRNPVGMAWEPTTGALWVAVNERDELGNDLVPDYMTAVQGRRLLRLAVQLLRRSTSTSASSRRAPTSWPRRSCPTTRSARTPRRWASRTRRATAWRRRSRRGMFVGQHGSWNRKPRSGYKVIFVPFDDGGKPAGMPIDVLTGFVRENGDAMGRPVGVAIDRARRAAGRRRRRQRRLARQRRGRR